MAETSGSIAADNTAAAPAVPVLGAILAGGRSSRFGRDKADALLDGRRLLDHVAEQLRPQVATLVVTGGPERSGFTVVPDRPGPDLGPLGGLNAALQETRRRGLPWVVTVPCDAARFPGDLVTGLLAGIGGAPAAYLHTDGRDHPTIGLWSAGLAPKLDEWLVVERPARERSVRRWAATVGAITIPFPARCIVNVNTEDDLIALTRSDCPSR